MADSTPVSETDLWHYIETHKHNVEKALRDYLPYAPEQIRTNFNEALEYSLFPGGKRLRPF